PVAHLAHENDIRVLPNGVLERDAPVAHVDTDFALIDDGLLAGEKVFDGVFNGEDVDLLALIDVIEHGRQGGALAASCHSREDDHPLVKLAHLLQNGRKAQLLECRYDRVDAASDQAEQSALFEKIDTKSAFALADAVSEIGAAMVLEQITGPFRQNRPQQ